VGAPRSFHLALIEVGTSLLLTMVDSCRLALTLTSLGAMGMTVVTGSYGRSRRMSPSRFSFTWTAAAFK
jgi:hypothetical protein